jgi:hypothetical protein
LFCFSDVYHHAFGFMFCWLAAMFLVMLLIILFCSLTAIFIMLLSVILCWLAAMFLIMLLIILVFFAGSDASYHSFDYYVLLAGSDVSYHAFSYFVLLAGSDVSRHAFSCFVLLARVFAGAAGAAAVSARGRRSRRRAADDEGRLPRGCGRSLRHGMTGARHCHPAGAVFLRVALLHRFLERLSFVYYFFKNLFGPRVSSVLSARVVVWARVRGSCNAVRIRNSTTGRRFPWARCASSRAR